MLSWGQDCPSPSSSGCCLPAPLPLAGDGLVHSWLALLWCLLSPLICEWARLPLGLEFFAGKFSVSLSLSLWLSHSLGCYLMLAPSDCPQGIQPCPCPKHATHNSLFSPCSLLVDRASGLLLHWELQLGMYSVGFFSPPFLVMLPSEIPKLRTDLPVRGCSGVWQLLLLHDSLPGMGLHP